MSRSWWDCPVGLSTSTLRTRRGPCGVDHLSPPTRCQQAAPMSDAGCANESLDILGQSRHLQNCEAAIAKFRFCASLIVNDTMPIRLPRSSNSPPPDEPADTGALIWMY